MRESAAPNLLTTFSRYKKYLQRYYKKGPFTYDDQLSVTPCRNFIDLAVVKFDEKGMVINETAAKSSFLDSCTSLDMDELVTPGSKNLIVEGPAGIGKSTICWELCKNWDALKSLQDFKLVLHLFLRDSKIYKATSLEDILDHDNPNLKKSVVESLYDCEGEGVLLVMDAFDEIPYSVTRNKRSFVMQLVDALCLPEASRLITSRPTNRYKFPANCKRVQILGFSDESKLKYVEHAFKSEPEICAHFKSFMHSNSVISDLMVMPVNCAIITQVYPKNIKGCRKVMSDEMTQHYLLMVLTRRRMREADKYSSMEDEYRDLPEDVVEILEKVRK